MHVTDVSFVVRTNAAPENLRRSALAWSKFLQQYLYEVRPFDAPVYGGVAALLALVVLLASYIPARQAARLDPLLTLKHE